MKKLISVALVCIMLVSFAVPFNSSALTNDTEAYEPGDASGDGRINAVDALTVRKYLSNAGNFAMINAAADTNFDGRINAADVLVLRQYLSGIKDSIYDKSKYKVDSLSIAGVNISKFDIILPTDATENMIFAASELTKYIKQACGVELKTTYADNVTTSNHIFITLDATGELGKEGIDIKVENSNLYLTGGILRGTMYAVYDFLERYVGYVFINVDNVYLYEKSGINISNGTSYKHVPTVTDRDSQTWSYSGAQYESALRLKINSIKNRGYIERSAKYGYGEGNIGSAHSMAEYTNVSNSQQICYSDEERFDEVLANVLKKVKSKYEKGDNTDRISVGPMDNTNYCVCPYCRGVNPDDEYYQYSYKVQGSFVGPQLNFVNRIAEVMKTEYPDTHVVTIAYWEARIPPATLKPNDNVDIMFCWTGCNKHSFDGSECELACGENMYKNKTANYNNATESSYFEKWNDITNNIFVWIYATSYASFMAQPMYTDQIRESIKYLADKGVYGIYCEGFYGVPDDYKDGNCFDALTMYMLTRCMWDPDMSDETYNAYVDEFLMIFYGEGWQEVRNYLDFANEASSVIGHCWTNNFNWAFDSISRTYYAENAEKVFSYIDNALAAQMTDAQRSNMIHLAASAYWIALSATYDDKYTAGSDAEKATYTDRYTTLYNWMIDYNIMDLDGKTGAFNKRFDLSANPYTSWTGLPSYEEFLPENLVPVSDIVNK